MIKTYKNIWFLLAKKEKTNALFLLFFMICTGVLEIVGIGSIMPFLGVLGNPGFIESNKYILFVYKYFDFNTTNSFLIFLGSVSMFILLISTAFKTLTYYLLYKFSNMTRHHLSQNLLMKYLHQPYSFFLMKNSSKLSKNILSEIDLYISQILTPSLMLITYSIIVVLSTISLVVINPELAFILISLFGGFYLVIYLSIRKYLVKLGRDRENANTKRFKIISETIGGIKDLKVFGKEKVYLDSFDNPSYVFSMNGAVSQTLSSVPQFLLEVMAFGSILAMAMYSLVSEEMDLGGLLPILGLYTLAALKLKPALNQIYSSLSSMKFGSPSLEILCTELSQSDNELVSIENNNRRLKLKSSLMLKNVNFKYETSKLILQDINIHIKSNTTVGIIGETGSGKSTLIDLILGLLSPTQGSISVDGESLNEENIRSWQNTIGYVPQNIFLADDTIANNIAFGIEKDNVDINQIKKVAKMAQIDDFIVTLEDGYATQIGERGIRLSGGQRQRLGIARALYINPDLLLLDEATSALDNETEREIMKSIETMHGNITIIMIAHRLNTVEKCDMIIELENGTIKPKKESNV